MNLYVLSYNNYYNRIVKKEDNFNSYAPFVIYGPVQGVYGFTPGDGVNTTQILGSNVQMYDGTGDYLLAVNENNEIDSRWFIIDIKRERNGQWTLTLHRDLIVDFYDNIVNSPMFIEKATLPSSSPLVFNDENITVNQIKTSETLIKDETNTAWIVGYYSKTVGNLQGTVQVSTSDGLAENIGVPVENWEYYQYTNENTPFAGTIKNLSYLITATGFADPYSLIGGDQAVNVKLSSETGDVESYERINSTSSTLTVKNRAWIDSAYADQVSNMIKGNLSTLNNYARNYYTAATTEQLNSFLAMNGKTIVDSNGRYYTISIGTTSDKQQTVSIGAGNLFNNLKSMCQSYTLPNSENLYLSSPAPNNQSYKMDYTVGQYFITLTEDVSRETTYNITTNRINTLDAPWNIFCMPLGSKTFVNSGGDVIFIQTDSDIGIKTAMSMQVQHPGEIYDIQILPYCPMRGLVEENGAVRLSNEKQYSWINDPDGNHLGVILNVPRAKFSFDITQYTFNSGSTAITKKLNNQCDKWRLTSPNYSNYFDFSVEKNNGIQYFNVDCEYKPFTPYIHINPNFNNLYGYDDNSPRGLVLGGDFSLSQIINQWQQYQLQNKNFQNIFDRQIQNMEVQNKYGRIQDIVGAVTGAGAGAASGALAGSMVPGVGTAAGAIAGGIGSAVAGIADIAINEQLRQEAMDYTKDLFGYQLGNIQALPNTISKVSALNNNNKLFPVLEYYTCTEEEKKAFLNKIAWNGMTVMAIGTMSEFINNSWSYNDVESKGYVKGQLIRLEPSSDEDFHLVNSISGELYKGVYIQ